MNEQMMKLKKVTKSCKTAGTLTKIFEILMFAAAALCLVAAVLCMMFKTQINEAFVNGMGTMTVNMQTNGVINLGVNVDHLIEAQQYATAITFAAAFAFIVCLIMAICFLLINRIFAEIVKSESPFNSRVMKRLKGAFITIAILMLLFCGVGLGIVLAISFWCIYTIMDYGAALQTEIDETV